MQDGPRGAQTNKTLTEWMDSKNMAPQFMKDMKWDQWYFQEAPTSEKDSFIDAVNKFFKVQSANQLEDAATKRGLTLTKICNSKDTVKNIQLDARDFWVNLRHEDLNETIKYPGAFAIFSETPIKITRRAPLIGEHNRDIYIKEMKLSDDQFANLKANNII